LDIDWRTVTDDAVLRAADSDRDRVAAVLGEALATGRLTSVEHADRLDAAYSAKTVGELAPIIHDLPDISTTSRPALVDQQTVRAVFSKVIRKGRWVASRHTTLSATYGALIVDLSDAVLPGREITLTVNAYAAKLIIRVPDDAEVIDEVAALFAKRQVSGGAGSGGPVIRVVGRVTFGKVVVARGVTDWNLA
jgi:hypothetical protein